MCIFLLFSKAISKQVCLCSFHVNVIFNSVHLSCLVVHYANACFRTIRIVRKVLLIVYECLSNFEHLFEPFGDVSITIESFIKFVFSCSWIEDCF
jgi:hypothetical protein